MAYTLPSFTQLPVPGGAPEEYFVVREKASTSAQLQLGMDAPSEMGQARAFCHFVFSFIKAWTLKDAQGQVLPLTFEVFDGLDIAVTQPLYTHVNALYSGSASDPKEVPAPPALSAVTSPPS